MEVMSGIFCMDGGGHLVDVGVRCETVAEFHAVMPSAPSRCDGNWQDDKRQGQQPHEEKMLSKAQQNGGIDEPCNYHWDEQPQAAFIDDIEYFKACGNFHSFSSSGNTGYSGIVLY